jgi:hypothetical protein
MKNFKEVAYGHWVLPAGERTIPDWSGTDKLKLVENTLLINSIEVLTNLFKFKWSVVGCLSLSTFEQSICDRNNAGVATVIRRLNNLMIALMSISYKDIFSPFNIFITEDDEANRFEESQIAYNFDSALAKVSNSVQSVIPMKLGDGSEHGTRGPREVANAILAAMTYQVGQMMQRDLMRNQKEDFVGIFSRQLSRTLGGQGGGQGY